MHCPNCAREIRDTAKVCGYCGFQLQTTPAKCPECGKDVREGAKVCGYCGHKFAEIAQIPAPERPPPAAEQKPEPPPPPAPETDKQPATFQKPVTASKLGLEPVPGPEQVETPHPVARKKKAKSEKPEPAPATPKKKTAPSKPDFAKPISKPEKKKLSHWGEKSQTKKSPRIWIWVVLGVVVLTVSLGFLYTRGLLTNQLFDSAIGHWEGRDGGDGSYQTMSIRRNFSGEYQITYIDESATICDGGSGRTTFTGNTSTNALNTKFQFHCDSNPAEPLEIIWIVLRYDSNNDTLVDSWEDIWTRK